MTRYSLYILMLLCVLNSCEDKTIRNRTIIVGEWEAIDKADMTSYTFESTEICSKEPGFFAYLDSVKSTFSIPSILGEYGNEDVGLSAVFTNTIRYYRNHTCYQIEGNLLSIYDPALERWDKHYIKFISPDTVAFFDKDKTRIQYFARKQTKEVDNEPLFDQILIYNPPTLFLSGRYSSFFASDYMIAYGYNDFPTNCTFAGLEENAYTKLEAQIKQANILKYLSQLEKRGTGTFSPENPGIIFVRGNSMYSFYNDFSIFDSSDVKNFYRAYCSALFYTESLHYLPDTHLAIDELLYDFDKIHLYGLYAGEKEIKLTEPEYFYLALLLRRAPKTGKPFTPTYLFKDRNTNEVKIQSDGRCFIYWVSDGKKTVDIGFNFF